MTPEEALIHFGIAEWRAIKQITIGLLHATYKIDGANGAEFVLQRVHPVVASPSATADYAILTEHLRAKGMPAQRVISTTSGALTLPDEDDAHRCWRLMTYVPGRVTETVGSVRQARACGAAVGRWHRAMADFKKKLQFKWNSHPYDTKKFYARFVKVTKKFAHDPLMAPVRDDIALMLKHHPRSLPPSGLAKHTVHGDLKITNFIFDEKMRDVRAIIDLDTCAPYPLILDLSDAMRSWCGRAEDDPRNRFNISVYHAALSGYVAAAPSLLTTREIRLLPRTVTHIILNQALRFMMDYFEDNYFGYDSRRYETRRAANLARARGQMALWKDAVKKLG